jgi:sulfatase modifying factor 1
VERQGANADLPLASTPLPGPTRVHFEAAKSFVGTDSPIIAEDGEGPARPVRLYAFELETETVTNSRFAAFVSATGYVTEAERFGWSPVFIGLLPQGAPHVPTRGPTPWWVRVDGACWKAPEGPGSDVCGRSDHPVVQVSWNDARAFAHWCGGRLPTEAEWEHAARGGLTAPRFPWGDDEPDDEAIHCNIWQGEFPHTNTLSDGYLGTNPVNAFAPNGAGLYNMSGNVWEWTADPFRIRSLSKAAKTRNQAAVTQDEKVLKGGSFLCHKSYCYRYRIAARSALTAESSTSNAGFRVAYDA